MAFQDVPFQVRVCAVHAGVDHCHSHSAPGALIPELRELVIVNPVLALALFMAAGAEASGAVGADFEGVGDAVAEEPGVGAAKAGLNPPEAATPTLRVREATTAKALCANRSGAFEAGVSACCAAPSRCASCRLFQ